MADSWIYLVAMSCDPAVTLHFDLYIIEREKFAVYIIITGNSKYMFRSVCVQGLTFMVSNI